jgi:hypothetical protein
MTRCADGADWKPVASARIMYSGIQLFSISWTRGRRGRVSILCHRLLELPCSCAHAFRRAAQPGALQTHVIRQRESAVSQRAGLRCPGAPGRSVRELASLRLENLLRGFKDKHLTLQPCWVTSRQVAGIKRA